MHAFIVTQRCKAKNQALDLSSNLSRGGARWGNLFEPEHISKLSCLTLFLLYTVQVHFQAAANQPSVWTDYFRDFTEMPLEIDQYWSAEQFRHWSAEEFRLDAHHSHLRSLTVFFKIKGKLVLCEAQPASATLAGFHSQTEVAYRWKL